MARTYYAEGRQLAFFIRGICIILGLGLYFYTGLKQYWWSFFIVLFGSIIIGEIAGGVWTRKRRREKKMSIATRKSASVKSTPAPKTPVKKTSATSKEKLSDYDLLRADVHTLSGTEFERLMELYYKDQGYQVQRVGGSGDHEVDLILKGKEGYKIAVQCKRWKQDVGNDIVLRLKSGKQVHGCYDAWIVTTSNFTKAAREAGDRLNIQLINGLMLSERLKKWKTKKGIS